MPPAAEPDARRATHQVVRQHGTVAGDRACDDLMDVDLDDGRVLELCDALDYDLNVTVLFDQLEQPVWPG